MDRCLVDGCADPPVYRVGFPGSSGIKRYESIVCGHPLHLARLAVYRHPDRVSDMGGRDAPEALAAIRGRVAAMTEREKDYLYKHMPLRRNA